MRTSLKTLVAACLLFTPGWAARAEHYSYTRIADTASGVQYFNGSPSINDAGVVAFSAVLDSGKAAIQTGDGGALATIVQTGSDFKGFSNVPAPTINNDGVVAFFGTRTTGASGVYTSDGSTVTTIADTSGSFDVIDTFAAINNVGQVAFRGTQAGQTGVFTGDGSSLTTIADSSGGLLFPFGGVPSINDSGEVAFLASPSFGADGLYSGNGGPLDTIEKTDGTFFLLGSPTINASGAVAFQGDQASGVSGIYTASGGTTQTVADTAGGQFSFFGDYPAINDHGVVAFLASLSGGGEGIFTGADPVADAVIRTGDALDGSTVTYLSFFRGLNDNGQLSFYAELADGRAGVFRADPGTAAVPEPSTLLLTGAGLGLLGLVQLRSRRGKARD